MFSVHALLICWLKLMHNNLSKGSNLMVTYFYAVRKLRKFYQFCLEERKFLLGLLKTKHTVFSIKVYTVKSRYRFSSALEIANVLLVSQR